MFAASKTASVSTGTYQITRSLRFNSADNGYLNRTPASSGNLKTWTWSAWVKLSAINKDKVLFSAVNGSNQTAAYITSTNVISFFDSTSGNLTTTALFKDPNAWQHIIAVWDSGNATAGNRMRLYVNGVEITSFTTDTNPTLNTNSTWNTAIDHRLGGYSPNTSISWDGYMTEIYFIDGQALTPSSFGQTDAQTGQWSPIPYSGGSYGTNGFYVNFSDNSNTTAATLGADYSGNGNNFTPNNFSVTAGVGNDSLVDVPVLYGIDTGAGESVRGNYCTLNPLLNSSGYATFSNGNLDVVPDSTHYPMVPATFGMISGKWYWEYTLGATGNNGRLLGIVNSLASTTAFVGGNANGWGYYGGGQKYTNGSGTTYGASYTSGDIISVSFDADAGTLVFYKNGTSQGTAFSSLTNGPYFPAWSPGDNGQTGTTSLNFGQRAFTYTAPSGFKALCTQNLPTPAVGATTATQASKYFNPVYYTGTGSSQSITGVNFQPDFVWIKSRSAALDHGLYDVVRGVQKQIVSNNDNSGTTESTGLTAFGSDGFTVGALAQLNTNAATYIAWNWKGNGTGVTNTSGTITSTVSANTTAGFSVVTYTGNGSSGTVGHGLGVAPAMIIVKSTANTYKWLVYHQSTGFSQSGYLNLTDIFATDSSVSATSSTTFTAASGACVGTYSYVAYCFAPIAGYSAFGSYVGTSNADGPFLNLGFTPKYILIKQTTPNATDWRLITINTSYLSANTSSAEYDSPPGPIRGLANGVKIVGTGGDINYASSTYIYAAFASFPFKYALAQSA